MRQASWLEDFKEVQERRRDWLCDTVWRVYHDTTLLLMTVSWDLLERDKLIDPAVRATVYHTESG